MPKVMQPPPKWIPSVGCTPICAPSVATAPSLFPPSGGSTIPNVTPESRHCAGPQKLYLASRPRHQLVQGWGTRVFPPRVSISMPPPPPPPPAVYPPPPPQTCFGSPAAKDGKFQAQADIRLVCHKKKMGIGGVPTVQRCLHLGEAKDMRCLAWHRPSAWPASALQHRVTTKTLPPPASSTATSYVAAFTCSISSSGSSSFTPLPPLPLPSCSPPSSSPSSSPLLLLPLLLLAPPPPLLGRRVPRLATRGVAAGWRCGVSGKGLPVALGFSRGLRGRRSLRWKWGWSLSLSLSWSLGC